MSGLIELSDATFDSEVMDQSELVLVDFWAGWCPPCRLIAPIVAELAEEFSNRVKVTKANYDNCPETAARFGVMSIPTLMVFADGQQAARMVGFRNKMALREWLERLLNERQLKAPSGSPTGQSGRGAR